MRIAIQILLILLFSGCGKIKYRETEIRGRAISLTDYSGLADYTIRLMETEIPSRPFSPISIREVATTKANENGEFSFDEELRRNSKFEYTIEFDGSENNFAPDGWQSENLGPVVSKILVEKGKLNEPILGQVPLGAMKCTVQNNYNNGSILFEIYAIHEMMVSKKFQYQIESGEVKSNESFQSFLTGQIQLKLIASNHDMKDSIIKELLLNHDDSVEVMFTYP